MATEKFFRIPEKWRKAKGEKVIKWDTKNGKVTVVVIQGAETKQGNRHNTIGVTLIEPLTLFKNYIEGDFVEPIPAEEYEKKFKQVVNFLK